MATLTPSEVKLIRAMTGDDCDDPDVDDVMMQYLHDNMATSEPMCASSIPLGGTIVWVLRARLAKAQKLFNESGGTNAGDIKQKRDHIKEDLEAWETRCGMSGGVITIGTLDLGLDSDCNGSEYTPYPFGTPYLWWGGS